MTYMAERWKMTAILALMLLMAGLAFVGNLRAQLKENEVDFEYMAKVTVQKGNGQCLWNLAKEYYSDPLEWTYIKEMNKIPNEKTIPVGTVIYIPVKDAKKIVKKADDEIEKMKATEKALRDEIARLKAELKRCEDDSEKSTAENRRRNRALRECQDKLERLTRELEECRASNKRKDATIDELEAMLENVKSAVEKMKKESEMEAQEREMRAEAQKKRLGDVEELEAQLRRCRRQVEELQAENNKLKAMIAKHEEAAQTKPMKPMKPEKPMRKKADERSMIAAVAIMLVGSIIWIASD